MAKADEIARLQVALEAQTAKFDQAMGRTSRQISRLRKDFNKEFGGARKSVASFVSSTTRSIQALAAGLAIREVVGFSRSMAQASDSVFLLAKRLETFSGETRAFSEAYKAAQQLGVAVEDVGSGMARFLVVGRDIGITTKEARQLAVTFNQLARLSGATGQEANAAFIQLTQGLGAGVLRGQELNSVLEQAPLVAQAIADKLGVTIGALKTLGEQGKITAQIVREALAEAADSANEKFSSLPETLAQQQARLENAWKMALVGLDNKLKQSEVWQFFTKKLTAILESFSEGSVPLELLSDEQLTSQVDAAKKKLDELYGEASSLRKSRRISGALPSFREEQVLSRIFETQVRLGDLYKQQRLNKEAEADAAERAAKAVGAVVGRSEKDIAADIETGRLLRNSGSGTEPLLGSGATDILNTRAINKAMAEVEMGAIKIKDRFEESFGGMEEFGLQAARNMQSAFADFLFDPFSDGLKGMLKGFVDTLRRMVAEIMAQQILTSFFNGLAGMGGFLGGVGSFFGGKRARGGPVMAGKAYLVGEKGPELMVPGTSGRVIPGGGGGMTISPTYNIDARGATQELAKQLPAILAAHARQTVEMARRAINDDVSRGAFGRV